MKALILAAGYGTRLSPITNDIPKCLVKIKGKPLLKFWIEKLSAVKTDFCIVNTHYLSDQVEKFLMENNLNNFVKVFHEPILLGTASTLLHNLERFPDDDVIVMHADNYGDINMQELIDAHNSRPKNCVITMLTFNTNDPKSCGIVETDSKNVVIKFHEKVENPPSAIANAAIYVFSKHSLITINKELKNAKDISNDVIPFFLGQIFAHHTEQFYIDIGTIDNYRIANDYIA